MRKSHGVSLLHGEELEEILRPHPISFIKYHLLSVYLVIVSMALNGLYSRLQAYLSTSGFLSSIFDLIGGMSAQDTILLVVFWALLIVGGFLFGHLWGGRIPLILAVGLGLVGTFLELYYQYPPFTKLWILILAAASGIVITEINRRSHTYLITNYRIVARKGLVRREKRDLIYGGITDVYLNQGLMGRIFNFGTVVPDTASGLAISEEMARVQQSELEKKFSLYGVPKPENVRSLIISRQLRARETSMLREMEERFE